MAPVWLKHLRGALAAFFLVLVTLVGCDSGVIDGDGRIYAGGRHFGLAIGFDQGVAGIGAVDSGEVFVLREATGGWMLGEALRRPANAPAAAFYGWSVDLANNTLVVGSPILSQEISTIRGRFYIYDVSGGTATLEGEIFPPEPASGRTFGTTVAISSDRIATRAGYAQGALGVAISPAAVLVHTRTQNGWTQEAQIDDPAYNPDRGRLGTENGFGSGLGLDGDRLVIGSPAEQVDGISEAGNVRIYERRGSQWDLSAELQPPVAASRLRFGGGIAVDGALIAVVSRTRTVEGEVGSGAIFVYRNTGGTWAFEAELRPPGLGFLDSYGYALDADGDRIAVSAAGRAQTRGSVFVWARQPSGAWELEAELFPDSLGPGSAFGEDVALDGDRLLAGAIGVKGFRGGVYEFRRQGSAWAQVR